MRVVMCTECSNSIPLISGINYRVKDYEKTVREVDIKLNVVLGVYCAKCGHEETLKVKGYYNKTMFENYSSEMLIDKMLSEFRYSGDM